MVRPEFREAIPNAGAPLRLCRYFGRVPNLSAADTDCHVLRRVPVRGRSKAKAAVLPDAPRGVIRIRCEIDSHYSHSHAEHGGERGEFDLLSIEDHALEERPIDERRILVLCGTLPPRAGGHTSHVFHADVTSSITASKQDSNGHFGITGDAPNAERPVPALVRPNLDDLILQVDRQEGHSNRIPGSNFRFHPVEFELQGRAQFEINRRPHHHHKAHMSDVRDIRNRTQSGPLMVDHAVVRKMP